MFARRALALFAVALTAIAGAAARGPCTQLPAAEQERARLEGRCEGPAPIFEIAADGSKRAARAAVPDLRARLFDRTDARLARFLVKVDYRPSTRQRDWVLDQRPHAPALLAIGDELTVVLSDGTLVSVPNVRGSLAHALALLHRAGLDWSTNNGSTGSVVGQAPAAGTEVRRGTQVALQLALAPQSTHRELAPPKPARAPTNPPDSAPAGAASTSKPARASAPPAVPAPPPMPDLTGMRLEAARDRLKGFSIERSVRAGVEPSGTVIGQSPDAGSALASGARVRLVLSDGSLVRVPHLAGLALDEARRRLAGSELRIAVTNVESDAPSGTVVNQQPADGEVVPRGSSLRLQVSSKAAVVVQPSEPNRIAEAVPVPDVTAQSVDAASASLSAFQVERESVASVEPAGRVLAQQPTAGQSVAPGSTVRLRVSDGSLVAVPSLVDRPLAQARSIAQTSGLSIASTDADDDARVIAQQPPAGSALARGSEVRVTLQPAAFALDPAVAGAWQRADRFARTVPPLTWALAGLALLLLLMLMSLVRRRRVAPIGPNDMVEPVLDAAPPAPVKAPSRWEAHARLEIDAARSVARRAMPRGPEIGVAARLEQGSSRVRELVRTNDELSESTSEESR